MAWTLNTLRGCKAVAGDESYPVVDLLWRSPDWKMRRVALDIGRWRRDQVVLVAMDRFDLPEGDTWPVHVSADELDRAPVWKGDGATLVDLPPLLVGPFGFTISPTLMAAGLRDTAMRSLNDPISEPQSELGIWKPAAALLNREVFDASGPVGTVEDLKLDDDWSVTALIVDGRTIPVARIRHEADQSHFVIA